MIGGSGGIDNVNDQGHIEELIMMGSVITLDVVMERGDIIFATSVPVCI